MIRVAFHFSPGAQTPTHLCALIEAARTSVLVQAYTFTCPLIARALLNASLRGVLVEIILDRCSLQRQSRALPLFNASGIPLLFDHAHTKAHNKVMILDAETVVTGSYNFTTAADVKNADNCLVLTHPQVASAYLENYHLHRAHSTASRTQHGPFPPPPRPSRPLP